MDHWVLLSFTWVWGWLQAARPFASNVDGKMSYEDFVWFILSEEDKTSDVSLDYWFRCVDLDCDGHLQPNEMLVRGLRESFALQLTRNPSGCISTHCDSLHVHCVSVDNTSCSTAVRFDDRWRCISMAAYQSCARVKQSRNLNPDVLWMSATAVLLRGTAAPHGVSGTRARPV